MRILMVGAVPFLGTGYGTVMRNVGKILAKKHVVMMSCDGWLGSLTRLKDYTLLPNQVTTSGSEKVPHSVLLTYQIRKYQPEAVLTVGDIFVWKGLKQNIKIGLGARKGKAINCPWVAYFPVDGGPLPSGFKEQIAKDVDFPVTMSDFGLKTVTETGIDCKRIYHGVDTESFRPLEKEKMRALLDMPKDALVIGFVGSNSERKKIPYLLEAISIVRRKSKIPNLRVWLSCPRYDLFGWHLPEYLKAFDLRDITTFSPFIDEMSLSLEELIAVYNSLDVHASASCKEGFGLTHAESMACGVPNVAVNYSSLPEVIGDTGYLAKVASWEWDKWGARKAIVDINDMANGIQHLLEDKEDREALGKKARVRAETFDWKHTEEQWLRLFDELE